MTIYSSIRGLFAAYAGPTLLTLIGILGITTGGLTVVAALIVTLGAVVLLGTLYDYPRHSRFTEKGIDRTTFLRNHHLDWGSVQHIERANPFLVGRFFRRSSNHYDSEQAPPRAAGLVAVKGSRRFLLTNAREGRDEFDGLVALVTRVAPHVEVFASRPAIDAAPSNLYRRSK